jgi:hypothetical protein
MTAKPQSKSIDDQNGSATTTTTNKHGNINTPQKASSLSQDLRAFASLLTYGLCHPREFYTGTGPTLNELTCGLAGSSFDPRKDIGDLTGKIVFITGGKAAQDII